MNGDDVDVAAHQEAQTKTFGVKIVAGETAVFANPGFTMLEAEVHEVQGKTEAVCACTLLEGERIAISMRFMQPLPLQARVLDRRRASERDAGDALVARRETVGVLGQARLHLVHGARDAGIRAMPPPTDRDCSIVAQTE